MRRIFSVIVAIFAVIGLLVVAGAVASVVLFEQLTRQASPDLPDQIILEVDFTGEIGEGVSNQLPIPLGGNSQSVTEIVALLDRAADDDRVRTLIANVGLVDLGMAQAQELRDAISRFRAAGKSAYAYADTFGEGGAGGGNTAYYLASAFEEIWLQPVGSVGLTGLSAEVPFLRNLFDDYGVQFAGGQRSEYKTAANFLFESGLTPAHEEMLQSRLQDLSDQLTNDVAASRGLAPVAVTSAIAVAPLLASEARVRGLIDQIGHYDALVERSQSDQPGTEVVDLAGYARGSRPEMADGDSAPPKIAVIYGLGPIVRGRNESPLDRNGQMAADDVVDAFDAAIEDDDVRAIVFRVDSPGGSAVASETIRRAVERARNSGRPVIVSMGNVAGSGGYWVSMGATRIVAQPATLTGSIGVVAVKPVLTEFLENNGIDVEHIAIGPNAGIWSFAKAFSPTERARLNAFLDEIYAAFKAGVANGRNMSEEEVEALARGFVWTGRQAVDNGLVDTLGGLDTAIDLARDEAGMTRDEPVNLVPLPAPPSIPDFLVEFVGGNTQGARDLAALARLLAVVHPWQQRLEPRAGHAEMPPIVLSR